LDNKVQDYLVSHCLHFTPITDGTAFQHKLVLAQGFVNYKQSCVKLCDLVLNQGQLTHDQKGS